jgi:SNF2 family DNA or RNA helicase
MTQNSDAESQEFSDLIALRMLRFDFLLKKGKFNFKKYQYDGVEWCIRNELIKGKGANIKGGFIADEMGLGKTIMMIGTMFSNFLPRTLIVVPPVLIQQWYNEIYKASGHKALMYYGNQKQLISMDALSNARIVLTTYNMILPDKCDLKNILWNRVIFDEAHHLRNNNTKRFESCCKIRAPIRWLVTGTPVQNKKTDFYNLCNAAGMKSTFYKDPANLRIIGKNYILRRTKAQVGIDLLPVCKTDCVVPWSNRIEQRLSQEIHSMLPDKMSAGFFKDRYITNTFLKKDMLVAIMRARQTCVLPSLIKGHLETNDSYEEAFQHSSKLDAVIKMILARKDNGTGKIIFCHYIKEIDAIAERLRQGGMKKITTYDGRNSGGETLATLAEPADALVIQIQTGCEGLNLQHHFSEIYFVSPHWNPCVEDQAVARCHRIGQTRQVDVFKFEMTGFEDEDKDDKQPGTLDTYVNKVQHLKRDFSTEILNCSL